METKKGLTKNQKIAVIVIFMASICVFLTWDYTVMKYDKDTNTRQIPLMNLKGVTHYYWEYGPGTIRSGMINQDITVDSINNTFSVYAEPGDWIRVHYLHEITPDHYLELEVEVVVIR